jgi:hypothetical protein
MTCGASLHTSVVRSDPAYRKELLRRLTYLLWDEDR